MNKEKWKKRFYSYTDFCTLRGIGEGWINHIASYFPIGNWISIAGGWQIGLWAMNIHWIQWWMIVAFLALKFYSKILIGWLGGRITIWIGLYKAQQQYGAKKETINPYEKEHRDQLIAIGNALGIKSKFTEL